MMRRLTLFVVAGAAVVTAALIIHDFTKLGRKLPAPANAEGKATAIVVEKAARRLTLFRDGIPIRTYAIVLGGAPEGNKEQEGDQRTPEGRYAIDFKNARSRFHLALRISYPSAHDRARASHRGIPPGGDIMIHGIRNGIGWIGGLHRVADWTDGCIAVTNTEIEQIWAAVEVGTPIEIRP